MSHLSWFQKFYAQNYIVYAPLSFTELKQAVGKENSFKELCIEKHETVLFLSFYEIFFLKISILMEIISNGRFKQKIVDLLKENIMVAFCKFFLNELLQAEAATGGFLQKRCSAII